MYEAQADTIDVDDIASNINNRIVLRRLKRNNADENDELRIQNEHDDDEDDEGCYYRLRASAPVLAGKPVQSHFFASRLSKNKVSYKLTSNKATMAMILP